jgi:hypothetical protein
LTASEFRTRDLNQKTYDTVSRELSEIKKTVKSLKSSIGEAEALMDSGGHLGDSWFNTIDYVKQWEQELKSARAERTRQEAARDRAWTALTGSKWIIHAA